MLLAEQSQKWFPTHVQVTVLEARNLSAKGKGATNDAYTIIQLGKEKYSTSVAEKSLSPVWKEEASFELPGLLVPGTPERYELILIVMHRSLVGLDRFLGQAAISLNDIFEDKQRKKTEWFKLESKPGKKAKERGEIKASIQFVRNNMTASMFDLSIKDKSRSPFSKLKDKMKGRKHDGTFSDTSSAIIPTRSGSTPDASLVAPGFEASLKPKVRKPFLLGPQRLSAAHSMSDLMGTQGSKHAGVGQSMPVQRQLESVTSGDESGSLKSPHRRTLSADTSKTSVSEGPPDRDSYAEAHNDPFINGSSLPQKFATLPRQRNPFEDSGESWDGDGGSSSWFSKVTEPKKDSKKKDKISLFDRVTGKKEGRRSDPKLSNGSSEGSGDGKSPGLSSDSAEYESTNPFAPNVKMAGTLSSRFGNRHYNVVHQPLTLVEGAQKSLLSHWNRLITWFMMRILGTTYHPPELTLPEETGSPHRLAYLCSPSHLSFIFHSKPSSTEDVRMTSSSERLRNLQAQQRQQQGQDKDHKPFDSEASTAYRSLTHEEVVKELVKHKELLKKKDTHIRELEDYIDDLLVRVMEETPGILRVPYERARKAGKFSKS